MFEIDDLNRKDYGDGDILYGSGDGDGLSLQDTTIDVLPLNADENGDGYGFGEDGDHGDGRTYLGITFVNQDLEGAVYYTLITGGRCANK